MAFDPVALYSAASGLGGMLVGGFIVYHRTNASIVEIKTSVADLKKEFDAFKSALAVQLDKYVPMGLCNPLRAACIEKFNGMEKHNEKLDKKIDLIFEKLDAIRDDLSNKADRGE